MTIEGVGNIQIATTLEFMKGIKKMKTKTRLIRDFGQARPDVSLEDLMLCMAYCVYHIGISGGKDSTALLLWMIYESGIPREQMIATFCDTQNEAKETYEHIVMLRRGFASV